MLQQASDWGVRKAVSAVPLGAATPANPEPWSEEWLRALVEECVMQELAARDAKLEHFLTYSPDSSETALHKPRQLPRAYWPEVDQIVHMAQQPEILAVLQDVPDPSTAIRSLIATWAFEHVPPLTTRARKQAAKPGKVLAKPGPLAELFIDSVIIDIYLRAEQKESRYGINPLDVDKNLLGRIYKGLGKHNARLRLEQYYETALSRPETCVYYFVRQLRNWLKRQSGVRTAYIEFVKELQRQGSLSPDLQQGWRHPWEDLLWLAPNKGDGEPDCAGQARADHDLEHIILFFAYPIGRPFIQGLAGQQQTARSFLSEDERLSIPWQGSRALPRTHKDDNGVGCLDAALAECERRHQDSLNRTVGEDKNIELGELLPADSQWEEDSLHIQSFDAFIANIPSDLEQDYFLLRLAKLTHEGYTPEEALDQGLATPREITLWQLVNLRHVDGYSEDELLNQGWATAEQLADLDGEIKSLLADGRCRQAWMVCTLR